MVGDGNEYTPSKPYDLIVYIGRFQPPTNAHIETIGHALQYGQKVLVLAGSANQPRTVKNPWTVKERSEMIESCFPDDIERIEVVGLQDKLYNDQMWVRDVQQAVGAVLGTRLAAVGSLRDTTEVRVAVIGHSKDDSSYYLKMFPQWQDLEMENIEGLNATDVRNEYFDPMFLHQTLEDDNFVDKLSIPIANYLLKFSTTPEYENLVNEYVFLQKYKEQWTHTKYPVIFNTTDAVVVQSGHILLVQRRSAPGAGTYALPGGFLRQDERLVDGMIRELREETKLKVPVPILKGSIKQNKVYDHPDRSLRGRTITHAFLIELLPGPLSKVKGSDDAIKAKWVPLQDVHSMQDELFEDHYSIISDLIGDGV